MNSRTSIKLLRQTYPDQVLDTIIPRNVDLKDASFNKQDIFAYAPKSSAALAYQRLIEEVFRMSKKLNEDGHADRALGLGLLQRRAPATQPATEAATPRTDHPVATAPRRSTSTTTPRHHGPMTPAGQAKT